MALRGVHETELRPGLAKAEVAFRGLACVRGGCQRLGRGVFLDSYGSNIMGHPPTPRVLTRTVLFHVLIN